MTPVDSENSVPGPVKQAKDVVRRAVVCSVQASGYIDGCHERSAKRAALPIMLALEAYKGDAGRYPEELDELVPRYLESVKEAPVAFIRSLPYGYGPSDDGASYSISFPKPHGYWHYFDSKDGYWSMHD